MVTNFYNNVAQERPYRKSTIPAYWQKQLVKFIEKTFTQYYQKFKLENPAVIILQINFENL